MDAFQRPERTREPHISSAPLEGSLGIRDSLLRMLDNATFRVSLENGRKTPKLELMVNTVEHAGLFIEGSAFWGDDQDRLTVELEFYSDNPKNALEVIRYTLFEIPRLEVSNVQGHEPRLSVMGGNLQLSNILPSSQYTIRPLDESDGEAVSLAPCFFPAGDDYRTDSLDEGDTGVLPGPHHSERDARSSMRAQERDQVGKLTTVSTVSLPRGFRNAS